MSRFLGVFSPDGSVQPGLAPENRDTPPAPQGHGSHPGAQTPVVWVSGEPWWPDHGDRTPSAADRVAAAYRRHGRDLFASARGHYAVAIADPAARRLLLAIDRIGVGTLAFATTGGGRVVFGTHVGDVARHTEIRASLRPQALFDFMYFHMVPAPDSAWAGVTKLRRGHVATWDAGRQSIAPHWQPRFARTQTAPLPELRDRLFTALRAGVGRGVAGAGQVGAFLSGGLDSSTVAGLLAETPAGRPARTFSIGFEAEGYNELEYARLAARRFGADATEVEVTPDHIREVIPLLAAGYDEPFGNSSAVPTFVCARAAREQGLTRLLAGDGGDELFGGNSHYSRQSMFELYYRVPEPFRTALLERVLRPLLPVDGPFPLGKLRSYLDQARIPLPRRLKSWDFMYRTPADTVFAADFLAGVDRAHPDALADRVYAEAVTDEYLDRLLYFDWEFVLADNDLRKVGRSCELAGIEVRYPMLDDDVIDFSFELPPEQKVSGQELRPFYKRAMQGFLPDEILTKSKHGFGLPFGVWLKTSPPLKAMVADSFARLRGRGLFAPAFLDAVLREHESGHASYYGYAIWDLVMLEEWLHAHLGSGWRL
jgi:asparagine synthase (glutamine-hydrolysing)